MTFQGQIDGEKLLDKAESSEVSSVAKHPPLSARNAGSQRILTSKTCHYIFCWPWLTQLSILFFP